MTFPLRAVLFAAFAAPSILHAQNEIVAPLILRLPSSTRALAMGDVEVAGRDDDVLFYNPAQLVAARGMSMSLEQFSSTARAGALSSVTRFNNGGIAVGATVAEFDSPLNVYPVSRGSLVSGGPVAGSDATLVFGIGQVFKSTRVGASAKFVDERIGDTRNSRGVFDVGLGRDFFGYAFGLAVQKCGQRFDPTSVPGSPFSRASTNLPLRTTLGAAHGWNTDVFDIAATAAVSTLRDGFVVPAGGGEIGYSWLDGYTIVVRGGARRPEPGEGPITAGLGFTMDRLSIDYALETLSGARVAHRLGLRVR
jgi:hypothetical protein